MNPPRWSGPNADRTRSELLRRVERGDPSPAPAARANVLRLAVALVVALGLVIPASVLALQVGGRSTPAGGGGTLSVATDRSYVYDRMGDYAGVRGVLRATRLGTAACFWIDTTGDSSGFGEGPFHLVFPGGYRASDDLELLDRDGRVVARPGDRVAISTTPAVRSMPDRRCGGGAALGALHVERTSPATTAPASPTAGPTASATAPARTSGKGCAPTAAAMPAGASHARIADVDGDGRADTEWAELLIGGTIRFGITTASGATISGEQGFAGGGDRSFVVGGLANGVVVAITSEGRDSPVFTFEGCAFHRLLGKDLLPGTGGGSPFTFYSETGGGSGGCFGGRLALLSWRKAGSGASQVVARWVDVSRDGRRATLTDETAVIATIADTADPSASRRYEGISCSASPVLRPEARG